MSTKATISYDNGQDDYHFYEEVFDANNVYLELSNCPFSLTQIANGEHFKGTTVVTAIPVKVFRKIVEDWLNSSWGKNPEKDNKPVDFFTGDFADPELVNKSTEPCEDEE